MASMPSRGVQTISYGDKLLRRSVESKLSLSDPGCNTKHPPVSPDLETSLCTQRHTYRPENFGLMRRSTLGGTPAPLAGRNVPVNSGSPYVQALQSQEDPYNAQ